VDDLDPEKLWEDKGADYVAPHEEVLNRVARWIEADLQELWNRNTTLKHPWFLTRNRFTRELSACVYDLCVLDECRERIGDQVRKLIIGWHSAHRDSLDFELLMPGDGAGTPWRRRIDTSLDTPATLSSGRSPKASKR
jgi:hypothetical protein